MLSTSDIYFNPDRVNVMNDKSTMNKIFEYMALGMGPETIHVLGCRILPVAPVMPP